MGRFNYAPISKTAAKLIDKFGTDALIRRKNDTDYPVRVVISEYRPAERDGKLIQFTDRKAILAAEGLTFLPVNPETDQLVMDQSMQIVTVTRVSPGDVDVILELQVRR
jgi:hypothetical protein